MTKGELEEYKDLKNEIEDVTESAIYWRSRFGKRADELCNVFYKHIRKLQRQMKHTEQELEKIKEERLYQVMRYKYIDGLSLAEVSELMGISERHAIRLHGEAVRLYAK